MKIRFLSLGVSLALLSLVISAVAADPSAGRLRLVDLGADKCIPCKLMKPVLDELTKDYASQFDVVFIDVWKNRDEGKRYGVRMIPTQIFYDATGAERFRHEGFMAKKEIIAKWRELGVDLNDPPTADGK